jgi:hypothetical protein
MTTLEQSIEQYRQAASKPLSTERAAQLLGFSPSSLRVYRKRGTLMPAGSLDNRTPYYTLDGLIAWLFRTGRIDK